MGATAGEWSKANHEEMETRERYHVDGQFAEVRVELAGKSQAGGDARHDGRHKVVQVSIGRMTQLERAYADIIESLPPMRQWKETGGERVLPRCQCRKSRQSFRPAGAQKA